MFKDHGENVVKNCFQLSSSIFNFYIKLNKMITFLANVNDGYN